MKIRPRLVAMSCVFLLTALVALSCRHPSPAQTDEESARSSDRAVEDCREFIDTPDDVLTNSRVSVNGPVAVVDGEPLEPAQFYRWQQPYSESAGSQQLPSHPEQVVRWAAWYALLEKQLEAAKVTVTHGAVESTFQQIVERAPGGDLAALVELSEPQLRFAVCRDLKLQKLFLDRAGDVPIDEELPEVMRRYELSEEMAVEYLRLRAASRVWREMRIGTTLRQHVNFEFANLTEPSSERDEAVDRTLGPGSELYSQATWRMHLRESAWQPDGDHVLDEPAFSGDDAVSIGLFSEDVPRAVVLGRAGRAMVTLPQRPLIIEAKLYGGPSPGIDVMPFEQPWIEPLSTLALARLSVLEPSPAAVEDELVSLSVEFRCQNDCTGYVTPDEIVFRRVEEDVYRAYLARHRPTPVGESVYLRACGECHGTYAGGTRKGSPLPNPERTQSLETRDVIDLVLVGDKHGPLAGRSSEYGPKPGLWRTLEKDEVAAVVEYVSREFLEREVTVDDADVQARECRYDLLPESVFKEGVTRDEAERQIREARQGGQCDDDIRQGIEATVRTPDEDMLARGERIYERNCASCHGRDGDGRGPAAAALHPAPTSFTDQEQDDYYYGTNVFSLKRSLDDGIQGTSMAAYSSFSERDKWAVTQYVYSLMPEEVRTDVPDEHIAIECRAETKREALSVDPCAKYGRGESSTR